MCEIMFVMDIHPTLIGSNISIPKKCQLFPKDN